MARKSRQVRLAQAQDILSKLEEANVSHPTSFVRDMVRRLSNGKGLSPKMRSWLDQIIEEGVPQAKNEELYDEICSLIGIPGQTERAANTLKDFANKAFKGWKMSDKQKDFLGKLLQEARELKANGPWMPCADTVRQLVIAVEVGSHRASGYYFANRPGEGKAYRHCSEWLAVTQEGTINLDTHVLPKWACEKMLHSSRVALREMNNPTVQIGDIKGYQQTYQHGFNVIVVDGPKIHKGEPSYDVLKDGEVITVSVKNLRKRLKK